MGREMGNTSKFSNLLWVILVIMLSNNLLPLPVCSVAAKNITKFENNHKNISSIPANNTHSVLNSISGSSNKNTTNGENKCGSVHIKLKFSHDQPTNNPGSSSNVCDCPPIATPSSYSSPVDLPFPMYPQPISTYLSPLTYQLPPMSPSYLPPLSYPQPQQPYVDQSPPADDSQPPPPPPPPPPPSDSPVDVSQPPPPPSPSYSPVDVSQPPPPPSDSIPVVILQPPPTSTELPQDGTTPGNCPTTPTDMPTLNPPFSSIFFVQNPSIVMELLGSWTTIGAVMGIQIGSATKPGLEPTTSIQQALNNPGKDGYGALYREGAASFLNSKATNNFYFTTKQVKDSFLASLRSDKAATRQARLFKLANEGKLKKVVHR